MQEGFKLKRNRLRKFENGEDDRKSENEIIATERFYNRERGDGSYGTYDNDKMGT